MKDSYWLARWSFAAVIVADIPIKIMEGSPNIFHILDGKVLKRQRRNESIIGVNIGIKEIIIPNFQFWYCFLCASNDWFGSLEFSSECEASVCCPILFKCLIISVVNVFKRIPPNARYNPQLVYDVIY